MRYRDWSPPPAGAAYSLGLVFRYPIYLKAVCGLLLWPGVAREALAMFLRRVLLPLPDCYGRIESLALFGSFLP